MCFLLYRYKVTDTADADGVIATWRRSVEGLEALKSDYKKVGAKLEEARTIKQGFEEDLELLHLTGKGIFMEKNQEVRAITLQSQLDTQQKELASKRKNLMKVKSELLDIYQGVMNMLRLMKAYAPPDLGILILSENVLGLLRHQGMTRQDTLFASLFPFRPEK